jgi:integrase
LALVFGYFPGVREQELCHLEWSDVDLQNMASYSLAL